MRGAAGKGGHNNLRGLLEKLFHATDEVRAKRTAGLYTADERCTLRMSHLNPQVQALYNDYLGATAANGGEKAEHLLHTHYKARKVYKR